MTQQIVRYSALAIALALPLAGCEDSTGVDTNLAETTVVLSQEAGTSAALTPSLSVQAVSAALGGPVSPSDIQSINVTVTRVEAILRDTAQSKADSVYMFSVTGGHAINLLALPTSSAGSIQIAQGMLPVGTYSNLRLVFANDATITFKRDVTVGGGPNAVTYKAGTAYTLRIGGEDRNEIRIPMASFTIAPGTGQTISVTFDAGASIKKVIATPNGIHMPPVMTAKHENKDSKDKKEKKNK